MIKTLRVIAREYQFDRVISSDVPARWLFWTADEGQRLVCRTMHKHPVNACSPAVFHSQCDQAMTTIMLTIIRNARRRHIPIWRRSLGV